MSGGEHDSPAAFASGKHIGGVGGGEESDGEDMSWGAKARRRQRAEMKVKREMMEQEEERRREEEDDKDIEDLLE